MRRAALGVGEQASRWGNVPPLRRGCASPKPDKPGKACRNASRQASRAPRGEHAQPRGEHAPLCGEHAPPRGEHAPLCGEHAPPRGEHAPLCGEYAPLRSEHSPPPGEHSPPPGEHSPPPGEHSPPPGDLRVQLMPGDTHFFVSAAGAGYIIEALTRTLVERAGDVVVAVGFDESRTIFFVNHDDRMLEAYGPHGVRLWKTAIGSGFRGLTLNGAAITGEAQQLPEAEWSGFTVDVGTGEVRWG